MTQNIDTALFVAKGANVRSFEKTITIAASPADVYAAWATSDGWKRVYKSPADARIDLEVGGRYEWLWDGEIGSNGCQVLSFIPPRMISFSWNAPPAQPTTRELRTWVVVECVPDEAGTRVTLTHLGFGEGEDWDETYAYFDDAWDRVLSLMQKQLTSTPANQNTI